MTYLLQGMGAGSSSGGGAKPKNPNQSAVRKQKQLHRQQQTSVDSTTAQMLERMAAGVDDDGTLASGGHVAPVVPRSNPYAVIDHGDGAPTVAGNFGTASGFGKSEQSTSAEAKMPDERAVRDFILRKYMRFYFSPMLTEEKVIGKMEKDCIPQADIHRFRSAMKLLGSMQVGAVSRYSSARASSSRSSFSSLSSPRDRALCELSANL